MHWLKAVLLTMALATVAACGTGTTDDITGREAPPESPPAMAVTASPDGQQARPGGVAAVPGELTDHEIAVALEDVWGVDEPGYFFVDDRTLCHAWRDLGVEPPYDYDVNCLDVSSVTRDGPYCQALNEFHVVSQPGTYDRTSVLRWLSTAERVAPTEALGEIAGVAASNTRSGHESEMIVLVSQSNVSMVAELLCGAAMASQASEEVADPPRSTSFSTRDWDGASFDVGQLLHLGQENGSRYISFDRWSYYVPGQGWQDATAFTTEPVEYFQTDWPFENKNASVREFTLAPNVQVLLLDNTDEGCREEFVEPRWSPISLEQAQQLLPWQGNTSLRYSSEGLVELIRISEGC